MTLDEGLDCPITDREKGARGGPKKGIECRAKLLTQRQGR
jgi:hypothetical protein